MAYFVVGYLEDRFKSPVDKNFFCCICTEVLKDPVQCPNQHYFCKTCITKHLENSKTCPVSNEKLTEENLSKPPRIVTDYLDGLIIACDHNERGCSDTVELGCLKTHGSVCKYRPVACPNERCGTTVSMKDLEVHQSTSCEYRLVHCEECDEDMSVKKYGKHACLLHKEVQDIKTVLLDIKGQVTQLFEVQDEKIDGLVKLVQDLTSNFDKSLSACASNDDQKLIENILVLGGCGDGFQVLNSVEMYSIKEGTWTLLKPMSRPRCDFTAHYYKDQVLVSGGDSGNDFGWLDTIELLQNKDGSLLWSESLAKMPFEIDSHKTVIIDDHLIVLGGRDSEDYSSKFIYKIQLFPPFSLTRECEMPRELTSHGVESFGNDVLVLGGTKSIFSKGNLNNVFLYNTLEKSCTPMVSLPITMSCMATVKCGEDVLIFGGSNKGNTLNTVFKYNHKKSTCEQMPSMKYHREDCAAVLSGNKVYVMGGRNKQGKALRSMECFDLQRQVWEKLAPMNGAKWGLAAVLLPGNFV